MYRLILVLCLAAFASLATSAQGLGSSNKLFGTPTATPSKSAKKASPERPRRVTKRSAVKKADVASRSAVRKRSVKASGNGSATSAVKTGKGSEKKPDQKTAATARTKTAAGTKDQPAKFSVEGERKAAAARADQKNAATKSPRTGSGRFSTFSDTVIEPGSSAKAAGSHSKPDKPTGVTNAAAAAQFEALIDKGNRSRDERNYTAAEDAYSRAKSLQPRDARAIYGLGNLYSDQQRWEDAEAAYRAALKIAPDNAVEYVALSYVLTQPVTAPDLSGRYEEAERLARKAIELAPANALAWDQLGAALELRGIIGAETENAYRKAIQLDPSFAPSYAHLGRLLRRRGLLEQSDAQYKNALSRSDDVPTMILVADVMQSEQRYAESEDLLRRALAGDPRNPAALMLLGRALMTKGSFDEAESVLRTSASVSPTSFMPNSLLGTLFMREGKLEMAENALLQALRFVTPYERRRLAQQFEGLGDAFTKAGRSQNAARSYKQAAQLDPSSETLSAKLQRSHLG